MKIVTPGEFLGLPAGTAFVQSRNGTLSSISVKLSPPVFNLSPANGVFFKVVCLGIQVNHLSAAVFRIDIDLDFVNSTVVPTDFSQEGTEYVIEKDDKFGIFDETERVAIVQRLSSSIKLLEQEADKDPGDCWHLSVPSNSRFSFYVRIKGLSIFVGGNRYNNKEIDICDLSYKEMTDLQYAVSLLPTMDTKTKVGMLIKLDSLIKAQEEKMLAESREVALSLLSKKHHLLSPGDPK